jgi:RNA polymerase sigma-70 factor (ECF subfamily)
MSAEASAWLPCRSEGEEALQHERTAERDEAFAGLVARQSQLMFRIAYSLLRNPHDAEDAVQESFLKLYRGDAWQRIDNEKAFLARVVWRVALDRLPPRAGQIDDVAEMNLVSTATSPEEDALSGDARALLRSLIDCLPEELRQPLLLSAIEEMTSREIAEVMGIPEGTVRTRLMRAKAELKKRFEAMKGGRQ